MFKIKSTFLFFMLLLSQLDQSCVLQAKRTSGGGGGSSNSGGSNKGSFASGFAGSFAGSLAGSQARSNHQTYQTYPTTATESSTNSYLNPLHQKTSLNHAWTNALDQYLEEIRKNPDFRGEVTINKTTLISTDRHDAKPTTITIETALRAHALKPMLDLGEKENLINAVVALIYQAQTTGLIIPTTEFGLWKCDRENCRQITAAALEGFLSKTAHERLSPSFKHR